MADRDRIISEFPAKLQPLATAFLSAPFAAAPERKDELIKICEEKRFKIRLRPDAEDWLFEEFRMGSLILVGSRTLERLWAYCYGFNTVISELQIGVLGAGSGNGNPEAFGRALGLIDWANQKELQDIECNWPDALPDPRGKQDEHVKTANHIFLMTSARLIFHEIAHSVLDHSTDLDTDERQLHAEEHEADQWADEWLLSKWRDYGCDEKVLVGRALGVAFSHAPSLVFASENRLQSSTHPPAMERVIRFVSRNYRDAIPTERNPEDLPCAFLLGIIAYLLAIKGYQIDMGAEETTYPELFEALAAHFN